MDLLLRPNIIMRFGRQFDKNKDICESCVERKIQRQIFQFPMSRGQHAFDKIRLDIIIISDTAFNGGRYILHFYDSFSYSYAVSILSEKTQSILFKEVQEWVAFFERQGGRNPIRCLHLDNERGLQIIFQD
jgi:hypothetical protein